MNLYIDRVLHEELEQFCESLGQTKTATAERAFRMYMDAMKQNPEQIMKEDKLDDLLEEHIDLETFLKEREAEKFSRKVIYIHEAGHAVTAYLKNVPRVDIDIVRGCVETDSTFLNEKSIKDIVMIRYSGAIAEELLLGYFCVGSLGDKTTDFEIATELIKAYIVMTDDTVSKSMLNEELSAKVITISKALYADTYKLLSAYKGLIEHLSNILMTKFSIETNELKKK